MQVELVKVRRERDSLMQVSLRPCGSPACTLACMRACVVTPMVVQELAAQKQTVCEQQQEIEALQD